MSTPQPTTEAVIEKIRKLLALSQSSEHGTTEDPTSAGLVVRSLADKAHA